MSRLWVHIRGCCRMGTVGNWLVSLKCGTLKIMTEITFDEFKKAEIKIGTILSAEKVPEADKLIKLMINLGLKPSVPSTEGSPDHSSATNGLGEEQDIRQ